MDELVNNVIDETILISPGYNISLKPCTPIDVFADQDKIGSVISNLLSNAVKYSSKGTAIEVICSVKETVVWDRALFEFGNYLSA